MKYHVTPPCMYGQIRREGYPPLGHDLMVQTGSHRRNCRIATDFSLYPRTYSGEHQNIRRNNQILTPPGSSNILFRSRALLEHIVFTTSKSCVFLLDANESRWVFAKTRVTWLFITEAMAPDPDEYVLETLSNLLKRVASHG